MDMFRFVQMFLFCLSLSTAENRYTSNSFASVVFVKSFAFSLDREYMILTPFNININNNFSPLQLYKNNGTNYKKVGTIYCNCDNNSIEGSVLLSSNGKLAVISYKDRGVRIFQINDEHFPIITVNFKQCQ